jgi:6-phosphofructokinase 2
VKLRCEAERVEPGGGGINAARTIKALGGEAIAIHCSGGETGARLCELLDEEGIDHRPVPNAWRTRESFTVTERSTERLFKFILPGPALSTHEVDAIVAAATAAVGDGDYLLASGSLPMGVPVDMYGRIAATVAAAGGRVALDTYGPGLRNALGRNLFMIKPNWREFDELVGKRLPPGDPRRRDAAVKLVAARRAKVVIVTEGERGSFVTSRDGSFEVRPPPVEMISAVGGGDSFAGAALLALSRGETLEEACRYGAAAAAAAVCTVGTSPPDRDDVERILESVESVPVR